MQNNYTSIWLFIVNPAAAGGRLSREWPAIEQALRANGLNFDVIFTEKKHHAVILAIEAIAQGRRHLAAVGGDGTAHEVINGIFSQTVCPPDEVTFTLLPFGTGNDWIRTHRIPKNLRRWIWFFKAGKTGFQDIGQITYHVDGQMKIRYFFNVAGLSYDAFVVKKSEAYPNIMANKLYYLWLILRCLFQFNVPRLRVISDGQEREDFYYTINAGICRYSGGGMQLVPHARPADGLLAITLARRIPKWLVVLITPLFYAGKIGWHPAVSLFQAKKICVTSLEHEPALVEADGELLGATPVEIHVAEHQLKMLRNCF